MNNNFISAEEFLGQSEKVQRILIEWWKPQMFDLYSEYVDDAMIFSDDEEDSYWKNDCMLNFWKIEQVRDSNIKIIPLLQMHQLINFIEGKGILVHCSLVAWIYYKNKELLHPYWVMFDNGYSKLDALWRVAIQIAEGE
jgi:hypothetical protein